MVVAASLTSVYNFFILLSCVCGSLGILAWYTFSKTKTVEKKKSKYDRIHWVIQYFGYFTRWVGCHTPEVRRQTLKYSFICDPSEVVRKENEKEDEKVIKQLKSLGVAGLKIVQISDIHYFKDRNYNNTIFRKVIPLINREKPHIVVITGDITQEYNLEAALQVKDEILKIDCKRIYLCFGSHDIAKVPKGGRNCVEELKKVYETSELDPKVKIRVLNNGGHKPFVDLNFWIFGFGSLLRGDFRCDNVESDFLEIQKYVKSKERYFNLGISHNPDTAAKLARFKPDLSLVLCGHTHAGQVCLPWFWNYYPVILPLCKLLNFFGIKGGTVNKIKNSVKNWNLSSGCFEISKDKYLYVNRGIGSHLNIRLFCPPEITVFNLEGPERKRKKDKKNFYV